MRGERYSIREYVAKTSRDYYHNDEAGSVADEALRYFSAKSFILGRSSGMRNGLETTSSYNQKSSVAVSDERKRFTYHASPERDFNVFDSGISRYGDDGYTT